MMDSSGSGHSIIELSGRFDSNEKDFNYNPSHNALEVNDSTRALWRDHDGFLSSSGHKVIAYISAI